MSPFYLHCFGYSDSFEQLTGALSHVIPIMISVMTAKWIGDALGTGGIYTVWISMRNYPWLPSVEWKDKGQNAATIMIPYERLVVIEDGAMTLEDLGRWFNFPLEQHTN